MHDQQKRQNELENLDHGFLVLTELQLLNDFCEAGDSGDLENLEEGEGADVSPGPGDRRNQVDHEHAFHVALRDFLSVSNFFAFHTEVGGSELNEDVDEEDDVGELSGQLVPGHVAEGVDQHELEADGETRKHRQHQDEHVPNKLQLVHVIDDRDTALL